MTIIQRQELTVQEVTDSALDVLIDNPDIEFAVNLSTNKLNLISKLLNAGYSNHDNFKVALYHYQLKNL